MRTSLSDSTVLGIRVSSVEVTAGVMTFFTSDGDVSVQCADGSNLIRLLDAINPAVLSRKRDAIHSGSAGFSFFFGPHLYRRCPRVIVTKAASPTEFEVSAADEILMRLSEADAMAIVRIAPEH